MKRFAVLLFGLMLAIALSSLGAAPPDAGTLLAQQPISVAPAKAAAKPAANVQASAEKFGDHQPSKSFEKALLEVAKQAHDDGEISRWDLAKVRIAIRRHPELVKEAEECCIAEAQAAGLMAAGEGAPDWSAFLDFLKQLIKFLMELFA